MSTEQKTKTYTHGDLTIVWKPGLCMHSERCWRDLPGVFNPKARPWIKADGADADTIMAQIEKCPSGALSYQMAGQENVRSAELETVVEALPNGPLLVYGTLKLKTADGGERLENKTTAFCRCGHSQNKPFCDGAHKKAGFTG